MEGLEKRQRVLLLSIKGVAWLFDAFVILTLATVGIFLMVWIVYEFYLVMTGTLPLERGGLSILGSVLILYAISELLSEEIKHIKGGSGFGNGASLYVHEGCNVSWTSNGYICPKGSFPQRPQDKGGVY